ncbi:phage tail assembly chaperone GT [Staphylococcus saprophyticus]|uniref:phage tail assembly chaperone GT n=1 Tax=Staphylococcus saprophyticus TaxID=29385 RepID=UPI000853D07A|nr:hypothetical protein [Staphylococcus saprophyticus]OEK41309.1 hypothetical protein ASS88_01480 [Staphylococcus saprophyticus]
MKSNNIELATKFDSEGVPTRYETFVTRPTIKLSLVYECVSFLSSLKTNPTDNELQILLDLVVRIYDEQFTKNQLIDGLPAHSATLEVYKQVVYIAKGNQVDEELSNNDVKKESVGSWEDHKNNLKATIQDLTKDGNQSVNSVLDMPFLFVFDELNGEAKKKEHTSSMFDAFGAS